MRIAKLTRRGLPPSSNNWPRGSWAFAGYANPDTALQSYFWAANKGDLKALRASATGDVRKQMDEASGGKSETDAAISARNNVAGLKSVLVLKREVQADDAVMITTAFENGTNTQTVKLLMKKVGNDWKLSTPTQ